MDKSKITMVVSFVLIVAVFALIDGNWAPVFAGEMNVPNCVDANASGPDFLFNAKPGNLKNIFGDDCLSIVSVDYGPTFLVNPHPISLNSPERPVDCPHFQSGAPAFLVNVEPTITLSVAGNEDKCSPG